MSRMKNKLVIDSWTRGVAASSHNGALRTDGVNLYSYNLLIGFTTPEGRKVLLDYTARTGNFRSMTTSGKHISPTRRFADDTINPSVVQNLDAIDGRRPF